MPLATDLPAPPNPAGTTRTGPLARYFPAATIPTPRLRSQDIETARGDISLAFVNADVKDVIRAVLGDALGLTFVIDPRVQGQVTLQTNRPLQRDDVLRLLEDVLRIYGLGLQHSGGAYLVLPLADPTHGDHAAPPQSVEALSLQFISPDEMASLIRAMAPGNPLVRPVPGRGILLIGGTDDEVARIADLVSTFDVSALSGMSFALFQPRFADARSLRGELAAIVAGSDRNSAGVRLLLISRLNAVLAISRSPQALRQVGAWVERLDQGTEAEEERLFIYRVQNGKASELAASLGKIIGAGTQQATELHGADPGTAQRPETGDAAGAAPGGNGGGQSVAAAGVNSLLSNAPAALTDPLPEAGRAATAPAAANRPSIIADEPNNALIIRATEHDYRNISVALARLDTAPLQVMIEAVVAEVTLTQELRYGVQWFLQSGKSSATQTSSTSGAVAPSFPGLAAIYATGGIKVALSALESVTDVRVVSSPNMLVMNNHTASLLVGDQVPVATQQAVSVVTSGAPVVNSIEYRDTGVILKVTPHVNDENLVRLDVSQEVSSVATAASSTLNSPTIQQRKFTSTVSVRDGQTISMGGIISDSRERDESGVPLLKNVPLIGSLFKVADNKLNRTELVVLITPHVARTDADLHAVTQQLREQMPNMH